MNRFRQDKVGRILDQFGFTKPLIKTEPASMIEDSQFFTTRDRANQFPFQILSY